MGIDDSLILGKLVDNVYTEETQEEVNEESLFLHNQTELIKHIKKRTSRYELKFLLAEILGSDESFWNLVFEELIQTYSLNGLKLFLSGAFDTVSLPNEITSLIFFIKVRLIDHILQHGILDSNRENLLEILKKLNAPKLLILNTNLSDNESLEMFVKTINKESKQEYYED